MDQTTIWLARATMIEARQKAAEAHRARAVRTPVIRSVFDRIRRSP
jgi:hypothetical protein